MPPITVSMSNGFAVGFGTGVAFVVDALGTGVVVVKVAAEGVTTGLLVGLGDDVVCGARGFATPSSVEHAESPATRAKHALATPQTTPRRRVWVARCIPERVTRHLGSG